MEHYLSTTRLDERTLVDFLHQMGNALAALRARKIAHRGTISFFVLSFLSPKKKI